MTSTSEEHPKKKMTADTVKSGLQEKEDLFREGVVQYEEGGMSAGG